jgi:hypothetical protein
MTDYCARCGKPFTPERTKLKTVPWTRCCQMCALRNFLDGCDLPTPPCLLDHSTKNPSLTEREYGELIDKI